MRKYWDQYVNYYLNHFSPTDINKEAGLPKLRDNLFLSILMFTLPICILVYIPSLIISILTQAYVIAIGDTIAIIVGLFVALNKSLSIKLKKIFFSAIFYLLSIMLVLYLGIEGPGIIILICVSVLITLYHSKNAGLFSVVLNAIIYFLLFIILDNTSNPLNLFLQFTIIPRIGIGINLFAFNLLIVLSVASLLKKLNESFLNEKKLKLLLKNESLNLLNAKRKAEESDRLKTAFLANMSHEIRTPMNGILGFSSLLNEPDLSGEDKQNYINVIQKSGNRMLNIIDEIIEISKIESGSIEVEHKETNINNQIEYVFSLFKPETDKKGIAFNYKNSLPNQKAIVETDSDKLCSILINLVKNAIKYTNKGSIEIGYEVKSMKSSDSEYKNRQLLFFIKDTGIGIPIDRQEAIFDRFIQADISDTEARQGAGLGLAIARSYVEMMEGNIWVESKPEEGSTFYFTLPYHDIVHKNQPEKSANLNVDEETDVKNLNILIADDDDTSREYIGIILGDISKNIIFAQTGEEAVNICRNHPEVNLVLMDIRMPRMNGYEATQQIRQFNKEVIIIAQTAHALKGDREKSIEAGCNDYISKPIRKLELMTLIQKYFNIK